MKDKILDSALSIEAVNGQGEFEGYASVFDQTDSVHDRVIKGAFKASLARHKEKGTFPALLWQHDTAEPIGKWLGIYEDSHGLFVRGRLYIDDIARARQAFKLMSEQAMTGLSIGFKALESYKDPHTGERILSEIELLEISLVTFPALEVARVSSVKQALRKGLLPDERSLEAFLRDAGFSRKQAKAFISAGYKSLGARDAAQAEGGQSLSDVTAIENLTKQIYALSGIET